MAAIKVLFSRRENKILQRLKQMKIKDSNEDYAEYDAYLSFSRSGVDKVSSKYAN